MPEQAAHAFECLRYFWIELAEGAFEPGVRDQRWSAVTGSRDEDRIQVMQSDEAIHVGVDEIETWRGPPMPEEARLDVRRCQGFLQKRIGEQVDLTDRQVVCRGPVVIEGGEIFRIQRDGNVPEVE